MNSTWLLYDASCPFCTSGAHAFKPSLEKRDCRIKPLQNHTVMKLLNIKEGDVIRLSSAHGSIEALAYPHPGVSPEIVSVPVGQGHKSGGQYAKGRGSNILSILAPTQVRKSGALAWASTRVNIERTGESMSLPKFENSAPDLAVDRDQHVIQVTSHDS